MSHHPVTIRNIRTITVHHSSGENFMSESQYPQGWEPPSWQPQATPPAPKKHRKWPWVLGGIVGVIAVLGVAGGIAGGGQPAGPASNVTPAGVPAGDFSALPEPTTDAPTFSAADFTIAMKTTDKECFGSAGCNITADASVTYGGDLSDLDDVTLSITYDLTGDQSGAQVHTIDCVAGQCTGDEVIAQTPSSSTKLKAHVTEVDVQ
jgi:hypothetical protein